MRAVDVDILKFRSREDDLLSAKEIPECFSQTFQKDTPVDKVVQEFLPRLPTLRQANDLLGFGQSQEVVRDEKYAFPLHKVQGPAKSQYDDASSYRHPASRSFFKI